MKSRKLGRLELLSWVNGLLETDYHRIEGLADGIAYVQLLDLLHGSLPLSKLNFSAKTPEEFAKNLRVFEDCLLKLQIRKTIDPDKLARAKFADNMDWIQWLYTYFQTNQGSAQRGYQPYRQRLAALKRQKRPESSLNSHLIPNDMQLQTDSQWETEHRSNTSQTNELHAKRLQQLQDLVASLESELSNQVSNYRLLQEDISQVLEERNFYFDKLQQIEQICEEEKNQSDTFELIEILSETPEEFMEVSQ